MALTRVDVEKILVKRLGKKMVAVGLDGTTITGTNADMDEPMSNALRGMGITPASIMSITNTDLAGIDQDDFNEFLDRAELRLCRNIAGNIDFVDIQVGPRREALSQLHDQIQKYTESLEARIAKEYGIGLGTLSGGTIDLDFQESL